MLCSGVVTFMRISCRPYIQLRQQKSVRRGTVVLGREDPYLLAQTGLGHLGRPE